jgi:hypothetical protein
VRFLVEINDGEYDEILAYNEILDKLETNLDKELHDADRQFKDIVAHQGPLSTHNEITKVLNTTFL